MALAAVVVGCPAGARPGDRSRAGAGRAVRLRHRPRPERGFAIQRRRGRTAGGAVPRHGGPRAGGTSSPKPPPGVPAGIVPQGAAVSPDGKSVYVTGNSGPPGGVGEVFQYDVGADGTLSPKNPPAVAVGAAGRVPTGVAVSPD